MEIVTKLRQTVIDHDPETGGFAGATQVFQRHLIDAGNLASVLEPENRAVDPVNLTGILGSTASGHIAKLDRLEELIADLTRQLAAANQALKRQEDLNAVLTGRISQVLRILAE